jgi:hypothetical protein
MEPYQVILLVVILLLFVYTSVFLFVLSNSLSFRKKLRKRSEALMILCLEKQDVLLAWAALFSEEGFKFEQDDKDLLERLRLISLRRPNQKEWASAIEILKQSNRRLTFLSESVDWGKAKEDKEGYVSALHDLDANYRQSLAIYNADVGAYNYWVSVPGISWLLYLFGLRKRSLSN